MAADARIAHNVTLWVAESDASFETISRKLSIPAIRLSSNGMYYFNDKPISITFDDRNSRTRALNAAIDGDDLSCFVCWNSEDATLNRRYTILNFNII